MVDYGLRKVLAPRLEGTNFRKLQQTLEPMRIRKNSFSEYDDGDLQIVETSVTNYSHRATKKRERARARNQVRRKRIPDEKLNKPQPEEEKVEKKEVLETMKANVLKKNKEVLVSKVSTDKEESPTPTKRRTGRLKGSIIETSSERPDVTKASQVKTLSKSSSGKLSILKLRESIKSDDEGSEEDCSSLRSWREDDLNLTRNKLEAYFRTPKQEGLEVIEENPTAEKQSYQKKRNVNNPNRIHRTDFLSLLQRSCFVRIHMKRIVLNSSSKQLNNDFSDEVGGFQGFGSVGAINMKDDPTSVNPFQIESDASLKLTQKLRNIQRDIPREESKKTSASSYLEEEEKGIPNVLLCEDEKLDAEIEAMKITVGDGKKKQKRALKLQEIWRENEAILKKGNYQVETEIGLLTVKLAPMKKQLQLGMDTIDVIRIPHVKLPSIYSGKMNRKKKSFKKLNTKIHFFKGQTFSAAQWMYKELAIKQPPMCLDFASDSNPGGSYKTNQQGTQEEALFRQSTLAVNMESLFSQVGYQGYMPHMSVVHCPEVLVLRNESYELLSEPFWVGVIASALWQADPEDDYIGNKIDGVLRAARANGYRNLVLGAWGCGAFQNDPAAIAKVFKDYILKADASASFDNIVFAIPGKKNKEGNFDIFKRQFEGITEKVVESWHPVGLDKSVYSENSKNSDGTQSQEPLLTQMQKFKLNSLLMGQESDGYWDSEELLKQFIQDESLEDAELASLVDGFNVHDEERDRVYRTFVALYILKLGYDQQKEYWAQHQKKAREFLKQAGIRKAPETLLRFISLKVQK